MAYIKQGQGPTLVLVHGTLIDFRYWTAQMDPFAERSRVIAVSLRHHYPNPSTDGQSDSGLRVHAADIAALIRTLAGPPVHLVGHSYGGFVALLVARDHPGLVRSLVLEEPALLNGLITNAQDQEAPMTRRLIGLLVTLVLGLLGAPLASDAQPLKEVPRIGVLAPWPRPPSFGIDAFQQGLRELGYVEGQHLTIEWRFTEGRDERAHDLATELVQLRVAVIVASTNAHVLAAQQATRTILIVFTTIFDLVARGLVASIARRGGNLTGIGEFSGVEMNSKRLELLLQAVPGVTRVAVLRYKNPAFAELPRSSVEVLQEAARALGVALQLLPVHTPDDLEGAFAAMARERAQALLLVPASLFVVHQPRLLRLVAESRLPAIFWRRYFAEAGALMAYGPNIRDEFRRAATYVDKILKGAKPADLPVEQPMKFEFVINLKTAQALGLTMPPTLLFQADEIIR